MTYIKMFVLFLVLSVTLFLCSCAGWLTRAKPAYSAMNDVDAELEYVETIYVKSWEGDGAVIVGKLEMPPDASVSARVPIRTDGSYCASIYKGRRLFFLAHGYAPLEVTRWSKIKDKPKAFDAGVLSFVRAAAEDIRTLRGSVSLRGAARKKPPITYTLQINNEYPLGPDDSNRFGDTMTLDVRSTHLSSGSEMRFEGLPRLPYRLIVSAPGYVKKEFPVRRELSGVIDMGNIVLEPAPAYRISYKARVRQKGGKWIGGGELKRTTILCDGYNEFRFSDQRDGLGNELTLRMAPKDGYAEASFFFYGNGLYDLGEFEDGKMPSWGGIDYASVRARAEMLLVDGHLYYFKAEDINGTDIELLFRAEKKGG